MRSDDPESVGAVADAQAALADCPFLADGRGDTYAERAANYVRDRENLLQALKPGSAERLFFVAMIPESYDTACMIRPKEPEPIATHPGGTDAVH